MTEPRTPTQPEETPASEVARMIAAELERQGVAEHDLAEPMQAFGEAFIVLLGPHSNADSGFCWCQPQLEWCPSGAAHKHVIHEDRFH